MNYINKIKNNNEAGFSLIEVMVVIFILSIVTAIVLPQIAENSRETVYKVAVTEGLKDVAFSMMDAKIDSHANLYPVVVPEPKDDADMVVYTMVINNTAPIAPVTTAPVISAGATQVDLVHMRNYCSKIVSSATCSVKGNTFYLVMDGKFPAAAPATTSVGSAIPSHILEALNYDPTTKSAKAKPVAPSIKEEARYCIEAYYKAEPTKVYKIDSSIEGAAVVEGTCV